MWLVMVVEPWMWMGVDGGGNGGGVVGGGVGADAPPPVVAPQQPVVAPLQLPPQQQLLLQRVQQQQLVLRQLLGQMKGGQGGLLGCLPGGVLPDVPQLPPFLQAGQGGPCLGGLPPGPFNLGALGAALPIPLVAGQPGVGEAVPGQASLSSCPWASWGT